jgi:hypothetical protein
LLSVKARKYALQQRKYRPLAIEGFSAEYVECGGARVSFTARLKTLHISNKSGDVAKKIRVAGSEYIDITTLCNNR